MVNKFEFKDRRTFGDKLKSFGKSLLFWEGRKKGMIRTMDVNFSHIRKVFFPKDTYEKYMYLGAIPINFENDLGKKMLPIIIYMDYLAKPKWCPRWFLRFLHLFGNDNSIVRVRNQRLHNLHRKFTKGIMMMDWKTKWQDYDLRISAYGPTELKSLTSAIERYVYNEGFREELMDSIKRRDPDFDGWYKSTEDLARIADELIEKENENTGM